MDGSLGSTVSIVSSIQRIAGELGASLEGEASNRVDDVVDHLPSFNPEGMLRTIPVCTVLHGFGRHMSNKGSDKWYSLSEATDGTLSYFLSHNWSVNHTLKFLVWAMHFNADRALCVAMGNLILLAALTATGLLSPMSTTIGVTGFWGLVTTAPLFLLVMLIGHEVDYLLGWRRTPVFFDKACIHQTDPEQKKKGIAKLGAFVSRSQTMVVCYSDLYLRRLWTVYEFACFLLIHPSKIVILIPVYFPLFFIIVTTWSTCTFLLVRHIGLKDHGTAIQLHTLIGSAAVRLCNVVLQIQYRRMEKLAGSFRISQAACSDERDRGMIENNIVELLREKTMITENASYEDAMLMFDEFVRTQTHIHLTGSMGRAGIPWRFVARVGAISFLPASIDLWAGKLHDQRVAQSIVDLVRILSQVLATVPFWVALDMLMVRWCLRMRARRSTAAVIVSAPFSAGLLMLLITASNYSANNATATPPDMVVFAFVHVSLTVFTTLMYRPSALPEFKGIRPDAASPQSSISSRIPSTSRLESKDDDQDAGNADVARAPTESTQHSPRAGASGGAQAPRNDQARIPKPVTFYNF